MGRDANGVLRSAWTIGAACVYACATYINHGVMGPVASMTDMAEVGAANPGAPVAAAAAAALAASATAAADAWNSATCAFLTSSAC